MLEQCKDLIIRNFVTLMKECNVEVLQKSMIENGIFTQGELNAIFSTQDARHNKRVFFFSLQKKDKNAFPVFIASLRQTKQTYIADLLAPLKPDKVFHHPVFFDSESNENVQKNHFPSPIPSTRSESLKIFVQPSLKFHDNQGLSDSTFPHFYSTKSKKRGRVLILNNINFLLDVEKHGYRNGAEVDNANLITLFQQMGGWNIVLETNKTAIEMEQIIKDFAGDNINSQYDICFVIIMSHGSQNNDTIIYGLDNKYISASFVEKQFSNEYCKSWRHKPKIFLYQVCRGDELDYVLMKNATTETDSLKRAPGSSSQVFTTRSLEDILVCYTTLSGYSSHRSTTRGSWYIEILCKTMMDFAHNTSFHDLLMMVDLELGRRMSEWSTKQTSEHSYKGFNKKLYFHPGIYFEDETIKKFFN